MRKKGFKHSPETKEKMRVAAKGKTFSEEHRRNLSVAHQGKEPWNKGKRIMHTHKCRNCGKAFKLTCGQNGSRLDNNKLGLFCSMKCSRQFQVGENSPNWRGGIPLSRALRQTEEYRLWRKAIFERDGYKCVWCGNGGYLQADHIKRFSEYPELRYVVDNGRTLCVGCHRKTATFGRRKALVG